VQVKEEWKKNRKLTERRLECYLCGIEALWIAEHGEAGESPALTRNGKQAGWL
jgi:hypothetical protein